MKLQVPGRFLLVDHSIVRAMDKGALGMLHVEGAEQPDAFRVITQGMPGSGGHSVAAGAGSADCPAAPARAHAFRTDVRGTTTGRVAQQTSRAPDSRPPELPCVRADG